MFRSGFFDGVKRPACKTGAPILQAGRKLSKTAAGLFAHLKQLGAQVFFAAVGKDDDDFAAVQRFGDLNGGEHGRAAAHADENALVFDDLARHLKRGFALDGDGNIDGIRVVDFRNNGLLHVFQALYVVAAHGLRLDDLNGGIFLFQPHAHAHQRAGGAESGDEMRQRAVGLPPDLLGGGFVMRKLVVDVGKLVGVKIFFRVFGDQLGCPADGAVGALAGGREDDPAAERLDHTAALDGNRFAHDDDDLIALDRADHGEADAGVAAGGLDDGFAGRQAAVRLRLLNHAQSDAVLDAAGRVKALQLGENLDVWVGGHMVDGDERRIADGVEHVVIHRNLFSVWNVGKAGGRVKAAAGGEKRDA